MVDPLPGQERQTGRDIESVGVQELPWVQKKTRVRITFTQAPGIPLDVDWYVAGEIQQRANGQWKMPAGD